MKGGCQEKTPPMPPAFVLFFDSQPQLTSRESRHAPRMLPVSITVPLTVCSSSSTRGLNLSVNQCSI